VRFIGGRLLFALLIGMCTDVAAIASTINFDDIGHRRNSGRRRWPYQR